MDHQTYMARALELAAQAAQVGDVPVGCVIVMRSWRLFGTPAKGLGAGGFMGVRCM